MAQATSEASTETAKSASHHPNTQETAESASPPPTLFKRLKSFVPDPIKLASKARWRGGRISLNLPDRTFLESIAAPFFAGEESIKTVLDVGTDWYTWRYYTLFPGKEFHSIDYDESKAKFASKNHVTGSILELSDHYQESQFDLVMCNGVFGWGVNQPDEIKTAVKEFVHCMTDGGYLVVGWNDNDEHRPEGLEACLAEHFEAFTLPPLGEDFFDTEAAHRHMFRFYQLRKS